MAIVQATGHLKRFFPGLGQTVEAEGGTVAEVIATLDGRFPGLAGYLIDDRGSLRKHVNVFIGDAPVRDRERLSDRVEVDSRLFVLQALSGG